jgi:protein-S-isoprenylcysteine O-methyltransferase Ste14
MEQFIILGIVPGTDIQIGFGAVAAIVAMVTVIYLVHLLVKEERYLKQRVIDSINSRAI